MKKVNNYFKFHWPLIGFLLLYAITVGSIIIFKPSPFFDWDEAIYAQVGREMMRTRSFLVPVWQGMPWLDKPPIPSLFYGIVQLLPGAPEITTRIATLILSLVALFLSYMLSFKITRRRLIALLSVVVTSFLPSYFQRSQALNVDVFLLIGWLGYVLWYENLRISTLFLLLGVLSKSLLGYYPPLVFLAFHTYELATGRMKMNVFSSKLKVITTQILIASLWFLAMTVYYGYPFIQYQFIDSHFKRVASSIEQHFGQRTFYFDVIIDQFRWYIVPAIGSSVFLAWRFFRSNNSVKNVVVLAMFFVPWFFFLNLTKTKIAWYIYPVLPQFAFLSAYPLLLLKNKRILMFVAALIFIFIFFTTTVPLSSMLFGTYSKLEDHQRVAMAAKKSGCAGLYVLVDETTRSSYATLKSMDLVISTTTWWGNHPSIAYYADTKTTYLYTISEMQKVMNSVSPGSCFILTKKDLTELEQIRGLNGIQTNNPTYLLLQK